MATYDKNTDYQAIINQAVAKGDYATAAKAEQQRNAKITGEGLNYATTNKYSSYLNGGSTTTAPAATTSAPSGFTGSANAVTTYNQNQSSIINQMNQNSVAWHTADDATKKQLEATNQALAQLLGGSVTYDSGTGYWSGSAEAPVEVSTSAPTYSYSAAKPNYYNYYGTSVDQMLNEILNREDFSYNAETDPLYQQYQSMYQREGQRAMNDTLASAASTAGGMNSYAITAAQQANDYYNAQVADKIPELYQLAYDMYLNDIDLKVQDFGLVQQMDDTQYSRYRDQMSDWRNDRDFAYGQYRDDMSDYQWGTSFNYNASRDNVADSQWNKTFDYNAGRDAVADSQWDKAFQYNEERDQLSDSRYEKETAYEKAMALLAEGVMPDDATLKAAGISAAEATAYAANAAKTTGSGGGGTKGTVAKLPGVVGSDAWFQQLYDTYGDDAATMIKYGYSDLGVKAGSVEDLGYAYEEWLKKVKPDTPKLTGSGYVPVADLRISENNVAKAQQMIKDGKSAEEITQFITDCVKNGEMSEADAESFIDMHEKELGIE